MTVKYVVNVYAQIIIWAVYMYFRNVVTIIIS